MYEGLSAPLPIDQIDFRVQSINKGKYATILAYKDARVDMERLDQVVGRGFWKRSHQTIGERLYCTVSIWNKEIQQWIDYQDVGTESYTEKEKGQASDSFKRACFNLGIGRELYDYPIIQIKLNDDEVFSKGDGFGASSNLKLKDWKWYTEFDENGKVSYLGCKDTKGAIRYQWGTLQSKVPKNEEKAQMRGDYKEMLHNYKEQEENVPHLYQK